MSITKKSCALLCVLGMMLGTASVAVPAGQHAMAAVADEKLLSGNAVGGELIPAGTAAIATGASYSWLTEGTYATDAQLIASDSDGTPDMTDGGSGPEEEFSSSTGDAAGTAAYGTLIYDLQAAYKVSSVKVWADTDNGSRMSQFDVYASLDGLTYNRVGTQENTSAAGAGFAPVTYAVQPVVYARYIKIIMHKDPLMPVVRLGETAVFGDALEPMALLSNNVLKATGEYNTSIPKIATGASYAWLTEAPFVTDSDIIKTDNDSKNDGAGGVPDLIDGSTTQTNADYIMNSVWGRKGNYAAVVFNLNDVYQIGKIDVWTGVATSGPLSMDGYEVLVSNDGVNYSSLGYTANANDRSLNAIVNSPSYGVPGKHAKYVKIIMHNANDSQMLRIGEVAIWGWKLYDPELPKKATPDQVEFTTELKNYSTLYLDWSGYNSVVNNVNKYGIYIETAPFTSTEGLTPKFTAEAKSIEQVGKYATYFALKPETTYYVAVTPFHSTGGERKDVEALKITTPSVLGGERVGDIFAINDSPYGGGNYVHHGENEDVFLMTKLRLLRDLGGINKNRWWDHSSAMKTLYGKSGLNFHYFYHGPGYVQSDNDGGAYTFSTYNEPDLANRNPSDVAAALKANHDSLKAVSSKSLLVEPALGGVDRLAAGKGLNWLDNLYNSDGQNGALVKNYFDVMDVHPYVKYEYPAVPGLIQGTPEKLLEMLPALKDTMASHGDGDKPIIITEIGWSTYTGGSYLKTVDRATQRNYLARAYMHAIANGIRTVHWYDFADDGTETNNLEHNLGLIDWNGKPKESYYGYYTMIRVLKDAKYLGPVAGVANPYYGYQFWDENKNRYITALWDASWQSASSPTRKAHIATTDPGINVVGIDGSYKYIPAVAGVVDVPLTGAPAFIYSAAGVNVNSIN
ncbi:discoidin domain-containing protein [Paenibacillus oryzisoli]|uniref:discoidin domain-containing protein n=1 Tax=Paenibacillus oryzisoli TaxID=1850517 RepID=UPI003D26567B